MYLTYKIALTVPIEFTRVPCIPTKEILYKNLPAQFYTVIQSPRSQGERLGRRRVGSETREGGWVAGKRGQDGEEYGKAGKDRYSWGNQTRKSWSRVGRVRQKVYGRW